MVKKKKQIFYLLSFTPSITHRTSKCRSNFLPVHRHCLVQTFTTCTAVYIDISQFRHLLPVHCLVQTFTTCSLTFLSSDIYYLYIDIVQFKHLLPVHRHCLLPVLYSVHRICLVHTFTTCTVQCTQPLISSDINYLYCTVYIDIVQFRH